MSANRNEKNGIGVLKPHSFGGEWTEIKLRILESYLNAYTRVFVKLKTLKIMYIDAFAGRALSTSPMIL